MVPIEQVLLVSAILLFAGVLASKASSRLGVPALILFLVIGMLAGSEGPGGIPFDDPIRTQYLGVVALAFILFAGGLETEQSAIRHILWQGLSLSVLGVLATAALVGGFVHAVLGLGWLEALLLGAIVSSTDAAAVFSILRTQRIGLKGSTSALLEFESGSNDPMAVFLTTALLGLLTNPSGSVLHLVPAFVLQMGIGGAAGIGIGYAAVWAVNRIKLETEGLYPVMTVAVVLLAYGATAAIGGNGFLAVYLAGIVIGNRDFIQKGTLVRFHNGIAWLMQMAMFLVLGLLVFPSRLWPVAGGALLVAVFLTLVARPVAVMISLAFARIRFRQKVFVSWVGLRGAVPIVLATFPFVAGLPGAEMYFNLVFFVVLVSALAQGTTINAAARLLRVAKPLPVKRQYPLEFVPGTKASTDLIEIAIPNNSPAAGRRIMDLHLPKTALVVLVSRGEDFIAPRGATVIHPGDNMLVLVDRDDAAAVAEHLKPA